MSEASGATGGTGARTGRHAAALAAAVFVFTLTLAPWTTLWDRDEARFASAAVAMARTGDLLVPTFGGELRAHKPVLVYWLMAGAVRLLGPTELAVRLPSAAALAVSAGLLAWLGARLVSPRAGLLAGALLATSPLALLEGLAATTDAVLLAFVTLAIVLFAEGLRLGFSGARTAGLGLALGGALLTKGPVGLAVPLVVAGATLFRLEAPDGRSREAARALLVASFAGLLLFAIWFVPANAATGGRFLAFGLGREVVFRTLRPMEGHGGSFLASLPYYVPVLLLGTFPWSAFLPAAGLALAREARRPPETAGDGDAAAFGRRLGARLLAAWVLAPLALFTIVATKLPHYVLPCLPPLALGAALAVERPGAGAADARLARWLRTGTLGGAVAGAALLGAFAAASVFAPLPGLRAPLAVLALVLAAGVPGSAVLALRHRWGAAVAVLLASTVATELVLGLWLAPAAEAWKPVPRLAAAIRARVPDAVPVASLGFGEPSLLFYTRRPAIRALASPADAAAWARERSPGVLVAASASLEELLAHHGPLPLRELARESGVNVAKGERVTLVACERRP